MGFLKYVMDYWRTGADRPSPSDIIKNDMAKDLFVGGIYLDGASGKWRIKRELLYIPAIQDPEVWVCPIPDTNSMDPVFDHEHTNIYIRGWNDIDQAIMVSWLASEWADGKENILVYRNIAMYAVHRLKRIIGLVAGQRAWYFKGDNCYREDPLPATDYEIKWLYIGTVL